MTDKPVTFASTTCTACGGRGYPDPSKPESACTTCGGDGVVPA